jgi:hypothetical protein
VWCRKDGREACRKQDECLLIQEIEARHHGDENFKITPEAIVAERARQEEWQRIWVMEREARERGGRMIADSSMSTFDALKIRAVYDLRNVLDIAGECGFSTDQITELRSVASPLSAARAERHADAMAEANRVAARDWSAGRAEWRGWPGSSQRAKLKAEAKPQRAADPFEALTNVPGLVGEVIDWVADSARYPCRVFALGTALATLGTAMGRRVMGPPGYETTTVRLSGSVRLNKCCKAIG